LKNTREFPARIFRAAALVWKSTPGLSVVQLAFVAVQAFLPLLSLYLLKLIIDTLTAGIGLAGGAATRPTSLAWESLGLYIALAGLAALAATAVQSISGLVNERQNQVLTTHVQDLLHAKSIEVDLEYYETPGFFDTLHRAQREAPYRPQRILSGLTRLGQSALLGGAVLALVFSRSPILGAILIAAAVPDALLRLRYSRKNYRLSRRQTNPERRSRYFSWVLTTPEHAKEIRLFGLGPFFREAFRSLQTRLRAERLKMASGRGLAEVGSQALATAGLFGALAYLANMALRGTITLGDVVMYFQAAQRGYGSLKEFLGGLAGLYEDGLFLESFYEFMDIRPKVVGPARPRPLPKPAREGIFFEDVAFRYPHEEKDVLKDIRFSLRPGELAALVGENGSGKTTLIKLLCRLYDPSAGRITLDGVDLKDLDLLEWRRELSVIFQDFIRYHMKVRENIWFGDTQRSPEDGAIREAAAAAGAEAVIGKLRDGYETLLGRWFDDGAELSTGEWQKIGLARMFFRKPGILVLDEPAGHLDVQSEYDLFRNFKAMLKGRSAVIISHRFSNVRMADTIHVLEGGRIVESGSHEVLLAGGGAYARMFRLQEKIGRIAEGE